MKCIKIKKKNHQSHRTTLFFLDLSGFSLSSVFSFLKNIFIKHNEPYVVYRCISSHSRPFQGYLYRHHCCGFIINHPYQTDSKMCKQARSNCLNILCDGFAQTLKLIPCEKKPNCEIKVVRIPPKLRSTESYCPECRLVTKQQRKTMVLSAWRRRRREALKAKKLDAKTNGAGESAHAGVELQPESSRMGGSRGAVGGGFFPDSDDSCLTSEETGGNFLPVDENSVLRSDQRRMELVNDFNEPMTDAPTNEESPMLTELTGWFNEELNAMNNSNYATGPDAATALHDLLNAPSISFGPTGPTNQSGANFPNPGAWNMTVPQIPDHPFSPQNQINPALFHADAMFSNRVNPIEDMCNDEEFLFDMDSSDGSPGLSENEGK